MKLIYSLLLLTFLSGCATIDSVKPGAGPYFNVQGTSYSKVWTVSNSVLARQFNIVSTSRGEGSIKAEKAAGMTSWGEVVGVFITPAKEGAAEYKIEAVSLKRSTLQITGQNWENTILEGIKAELAMHASSNR